MENPSVTTFISIRSTYMSIPNEDIFCNKIEVKVLGGDLCDDIMRDMSI